VYAYRPKRENILITAKLIAENLIAKCAIFGYVTLEYRTRRIFNKTSCDNSRYTSILAIS